MSVTLSHPTGNANVRAVLRGLQRAGNLGEFHTTIAAPASCLGRSSLFNIGADAFRRRQFDEVPWSKIYLHPYRETLRHIAPHLGFTFLTRHETGFASVDAVYRHLDWSVAERISRNPGSVSAVYAYEDGALQTFEAAKRHSIPSIYELPIAHWRTLDRVFHEEAELRPSWSATLSGINDSAEKRNAKDREIEMADRILVPSSFVKQSLTQTFSDKSDIIHVVPFGCPPPITEMPRERVSGEPIRLFFAGQLTQRKGLAYLVDTLDLLDIDWRLTLAGPKPTNAPKVLNDLLARDRCTWIGRVPHAALLLEMSRAHVFVFPSLAEGFALVIPEAMSAGLPIITTPNAGADIVTDGREGYVVPIRNPHAVAERITLLSEDEEKRQNMAKAALDTASRSPWSTYEDRVIQLVQELIVS